MDYEKEQEILLRSFEEVEADENYGCDDDDEQCEIDDIEQRSECSDSEVFICKGRITKWNKHCPSKNVRTRSANIVLQLPGVKPYDKSKNSSLDIWLCLFDEEMLNIIVDCTNIEINSISQNFSRERDVRPTNLVEIKALIRLLYVAGVRKANHMNLGDLWRTDGSGVEAFRLKMNRIRECVHFDDIHIRQERVQVDKLAPIRMMFEKFNSNQKMCYSHSAHVIIDEKMEAFRDVGKQPEDPFQKETTAKSVVERFSQHIYGTNINVTTDNWFTSMELVESLKRNKLTPLGIIRKNKR
ncbi:hypothetical protein NQ314_009576 [Rhamnusium bicolor]|uniref:PiggyBac transposable element-derived protein domain-containing protein n=1 Tax=Rhamnusium bicolor TaxID=1586634 RepID=A0AAV8XZR5_9CUCU|nr:hypothetical protein NQ314_009576 [Rhamnusium bicolor]